MMWLYNDGEASFGVKTGCGGTVTQKKQVEQHSNIRDNIGRSQDCQYLAQDSICTKFSSRQQDGCQSEGNERHPLARESRTSWPLRQSHEEETGNSHCVGKHNLGETGVSRTIGYHVRETGTGRNSTRFHVRETGVERNSMRRHEGETGVDRNRMRSHEGETGVGRNNTRSHEGETGVGRKSLSHKGETGAGWHIRYPCLDETRANIITEKQGRTESQNGMWMTDRMEHLSDLGGREDPDMTCQRSLLSIGMTRSSEKPVTGGNNVTQCQAQCSGCHDINTNFQVLYGETGACWHTVEPKIASFDGTEEWAIWITRFEAIAELRRWEEDMKLDFLLPRLQGKVGEYAFTVLPRQVLNSYNELVRELNSAFKKIEIPRAYAKKFHSRLQGENESVENYATELKCLYYKAYKHRDKRTREEDLLQRFIDGLRDPDMKFALEFHKNPQTIDEAVYNCVEYRELRSQIYVDSQSDKTPSKLKKGEYGMTHDDECCNPNEFNMDGEVLEMVLQLGESIQKLKNNSLSVLGQTKVKEVEEGQKPENGSLRSGGRKDCKAGLGVLEFRGDCIELAEAKGVSQQECGVDKTMEVKIPISMPAEETGIKHIGGRIKLKEHEAILSGQSDVDDVETGFNKDTAPNDHEDQAIGLSHGNYRTLVDQKETAEAGGERVPFELPSGPHTNLSFEEQGQSCIVWTQQYTSAHVQRKCRLKACISLETEATKWPKKASEMQQRCQESYKEGNVNSAVQKHNYTMGKHSSQGPECGSRQCVVGEGLKDVASPVLLPVNKLLPCKGEKPPKWPHNTTGQILASVSMAA